MRPNLTPNTNTKTGYPEASTDTDAEVPASTVTGIQLALETIRSRAFVPPSTYWPMYQLSDGELDLLLASLMEHDAHANYPVRCYVGKYDGDDWLLAFGESQEHGEVQVSTDRVHCSQVRGDAWDDAQAYVGLRNNLPSIIASLEELLQWRLGRR